MIRSTHLCLIHLILLSGTVSASNSTYRPAATQAPPIVYPANERSAQEVEKEIYSWPKDGVSVHSVQVVGGKVIVQGTYYQKEKIELFLRRLRGDDGVVKREVSIKENATLRYIDFTAEADNKW